MNHIHRTSKEKLKQSYENLISELTWVTMNKVNVMDFYILSKKPPENKLLKTG